MVGGYRGQNKRLPSVRFIRMMLDYNPDTGILTWKVNHYGRIQGEVAGQIDQYGYRVVHLKNVGWRACRLIWKLYTGQDPGAREIDHINRLPNDDRWDNLRLAKRWQQTVNAQTKIGVSGVRGVIKSRLKWCAVIHFNGNYLNLGTFDTIEQAAEARKLAEETYHGNFSVNHKPKER
jgi:hypothetical protein